MQEPDSALRIPEAVQRHLPDPPEVLKSSDMKLSEDCEEMLNNVKQVTSASVSEATPIIAEKPGTCGTLRGA